MDSDRTDPTFCQGHDAPEVPDAPTGEDLLGRAPARSPYAVPMSTLLGGAMVAHADRVEIHPVPPAVDQLVALDPWGDAPPDVD